MLTALCGRPASCSPFAHWDRVSPKNRALAGAPNPHRKFVFTIRVSRALNSYESTRRHSMKWKCWNIATIIPIEPEVRNVVLLRIVRLWTLARVQIVTPVLLGVRHPPIRLCCKIPIPLWIPGGPVSVQCLSLWVWLAGPPALCLWATRIICLIGKLL